MADLTKNEITLIEKVIDAIISKDWTFLSQVPKDAVHNDQAFREWVDLANLTSGDIPPDVRAKTLVAVTGGRDEMINVLLRNDRVFLTFLRKHKTHDLRLLALAVLDAFAGSIEQKSEGPSVAANIPGPPPNQPQQKEMRNCFAKHPATLTPYKINPAWSISAQRGELTDGEAAVVMAHEFISEVLSGSIAQYLSSASGDDAELALSLFRKLGIDGAASALQRAKTIIFGGLPIPSDDTQRNDIVTAWEKTNEAEVDRIVRQIEGDIGWGEKIQAQLAAYIRGHPDEFPQTSH